MRKYLLPALVLAFLAGCQSNPYPDSEVSNKPEVIRNPVKPGMGIDIPNIISFDEGLENQFAVKVSVPKGNPILEWIGLPQGAVYDPTTSLVTWTPSFSDANDPNDLSVKVKDYVVTLKLRSDEDPVSEIFRTITLKVKDTPRPLNLTLSTNSVDVEEGTSKNLVKINFDCEDFPNGPFQVSLKNGQAGVIRPGTQDGEWLMTAPAFGHGTVKTPRDCTSSWNCGLKFEETITIFTPDGRRAEKDISIKLKDKRLPVAISLPQQLEVSGELYLGFSALDSNEEVMPKISITKAPTLGQFEIITSPEKSESNYEGKYIISWTNIPQEAYGKTFDFQISACNSSVSYTVNHSACKSYSHKLKVIERDVVTPIITRRDWEQNELKYIKAGKEFNSEVSVNPGAGAQIISVKAKSSDSEDVISYSYEKLKIKAKNPGIKFARIDVMNSFGGNTTETFLYEVLPFNWSSNLVIGLSHESGELGPVETLLKSFNRTFHGVEGRNARALALRKLVYIGTHGLSLPGSADEVEFFSSNLNDIIISTPNLKALPESIINELRSNGVYLAGRASDLGGFDLKQFELNPARALGLPSGITGLAGETTGESSDPGLLSVTMSSYCKRLFSLFKPGPTPTELLVGVSCKRENGGNLVVLGFEWADIRVSDNDNALPAQWFKRIME